MRHSRISRTTSGALSLLLAVLATLAASEVRAIVIEWDNDAGDFNYNNNQNWQGNLIPDGSFNEAGVISNGDAVFLNSSPTGPAGLEISNGALEIQSSGSLAVVQGASELGNVVVGGNSALTVRSGGSLIVAGAGLLDGNTRLVGPTATFSASSFTLGGSHTLIAEITDPNTHSALSTTGEASLGGSLLLDFRGITFTASEGDSWTVVDAGSVVDSFSSTSSAGLPLGMGIKVAGGNGQPVNATIRNQLVLSVNVNTGATSIDNRSATTSEVIKGYSINAATSTLNPNGWNSFQDNGEAGWEEANPGDKHLSELNLTSSRNITAPMSIPLGTAYVPSNQFGVISDPVNFEYHLVSGETRAGAVNYIGYTLVLEVDPSDGQAQIINPTGFDVQLKGYGITSGSGSLDTAAWTPLADSDAAWEEANPASNHVGELNLTDSLGITKLEANSPISLGAPFDFDKVGAKKDLVFEFHLDGVDGDFDEDGDVDGFDFLAWQRGDSPGLGNASDLMAWEANYGSTGPSGTFTGIVEYVSLAGPLGAVAAVPEPSAVVLLLWGVACLRQLRTS